VTLYADASAILKLYLEEPESERAEAVLRGDPRWITAFHTLVEVRRNLVRVLEAEQLAIARQQFSSDWDSLEAIELDAGLCGDAAALAERTGVRTLDALHLGAARIAGAPEGVPVVTFDRRLADAARSLGWTVLPA
jgi:predicted nucleic acid-binding protein